MHSLERWAWEGWKATRSLDDFAGHLARQGRFRRLSHTNKAVAGNHNWPFAATTPPAVMASRTLASPGFFLRIGGLRSSTSLFLSESQCLSAQFFTAQTTRSRDCRHAMRPPRRCQILLRPLTARGGVSLPLRLPVRALLARRGGCPEATSCFAATNPSSSNASASYL
jgi:hypothetical protein